jgi:hypothetical protein
MYRGEDVKLFQEGHDQPNIIHYQFPYFKRQVSMDDFHRASCGIVLVVGRDERNHAVLDENVPNITVGGVSPANSK